MSNLLSRIVPAILLFAFSSVSALADAALVIGNRNYQRASWMYDAERVLNSAAKLRQAGYSVVSGRDLGVEQTRRALHDFIGRLDASERVAIVLAGHFVHSDRDTWLVPVDANVPNLVSINYEGLSLNTVLELAAQKPGQVAVFLGTFPRTIDVSGGLEVGIGAINAPQGVFVATGKPDDIDLTIRRDFLDVQLGFAAALAKAPDSVVGHGFISNIGTLAGGGAAVPDTLLIEEGYWLAIAQIGGREAYLLYLRNFPNGTHAAEAQAFINAEAAKSPEDIAREAENALNLSRDDRKGIQESLTLLGYDTRGIDGVFGRGTRAAIANWQRDNRFDATGYVQQNQIRRLDNQAEKRAAELAEQARAEQAKLEREDREFWVSSGASANELRGLRRYLRRYPDGLYADVAKVRIDAIKAQARNTVGGRERALWDQAESSGKLADYEAYLTNYPDGVFVDDAKEKIETLKEEEANAAEIEAARKEEDSLRLNGFGRLIIENQLLALGLPAGIPDGNFDDDTRKAIRQFQRTRGFPVTGYLSRAVVVRLVAEAG